MRELVFSGPRRPFHVGRLRYDPTFSMEVAWCSDHGLPHSALLKWDPEDRAKLVAYLMDSSSRCQMCGTAAWEWELNDGRVDMDAYEPSTHQCWGCYVKDNAAEEAPRQNGATVVLVPRAVAAARRKASEKE